MFGKKYILLPNKNTKKNFSRNLIEYPKDTTEYHSRIVGIFFSFLSAKKKKKTKKTLGWVVCCKTRKTHDQPSRDLQTN